ncbi:MAG: macro domain-containing protein [Bacteroidota bacterium]|jgi:putative ATPase|nr:macro domain-containing protein [Bacteroidota bacterium]
MPGKTLRAREWNGVVVEVVHGDLTEEQVDAIVNAANEHLDHGGGVAGAIVRRGGDSIQRESRSIGRVRTGNAAHTGAGDLPARYVIHAVGPIWDDGNSGEPELLASAIRNSLALAETLGCTSIALPAISSGIFGVPKDIAAKIIIRTIRIFIDTRPRVLRRIRCTNIDDETARAFLDALDALE